MPRGVIEVPSRTNFLGFTPTASGHVCWQGSLGYGTGPRAAWSFCWPTRAGDYVKQALDAPIDHALQAGQSSESSLFDSSILFVLLSAPPTFTATFTQHLPSDP